MDIFLDNVTKSFGDKVVFMNFSYRFSDGKITAITGESGCGKTTLLRIISGLDKDFKGTVSPTEMTVSVAFQEHRLFPGATVMENMETAAKGNICKTLLLELGITEDSFDKFPSELSGGMARRVSLARAMAKNAELYIFDEPFSGLDSENAERAAKVIKKYCAGKTCIIVTHNKELAEIFADNFLQL